MFYERFVQLCNERHISPSQVALKCGFNKSSITNWKKNGYKPRQDILIKIASFFDISVDYLLGNDDKKTMPDNSDETLMFALYGGDAKDITPEMLEDVRNFAKFIREKKNSEK